MFIYLLEFITMLIMIEFVTPLLTWVSAWLIAREFFDGLLVWPWGEIFQLTIILFVPLIMMTSMMAWYFSRNSRKS